MTREAAARTLAGVESDHEHLEANPPAAAPAAAGPVRALSGPTPTAGRMTAANVLALQRTAGNASVSHMLGEADVRARTERATGYDLSCVSVQGGSPVADGLGVEAVTVGDEVHLGSATVPPGTAHGDHLGVAAVARVQAVAAPRPSRQAPVTHRRLPPTRRGRPRSRG